MKGRWQKHGQKGDKTKAAIRKAALALFVQKGFKDVTMKDICEAAGLSRGGLYTHYGSTGQVFADIIEELMSGLESQVAGKMEREPAGGPHIGRIIRALPVRDA